MLLQEVQNQNNIKCYKRSRQIIDSDSDGDNPEAENVTSGTIVLPKLSEILCISLVTSFPLISVFANGI